MTAYAHVGGVEIISGDVVIPYSGAWFADLMFAAPLEATGRVTIEIGSMRLVGTVDPVASGTRGEQSFARIVAGAGGWATLVTPQYYHADNGVRALLIAQDAARIAGETLGTFTPSADTVGIDYARQVGPASRVLEAACGSASWWVDFDGVTQVGTRTTSPAPAASYELIEYDPRQRIATLALDDISLVGVGSVLTDALDTPQTVRDVTLRLSEETVRVIAWTGEPAHTRGRLAGIVEAVIESILDRRAYGLRKCRVIRVASDRVEVQPVRASMGLPEMLPISMWPGVAGIHATLTPGSEVLVQFVDGDRSQPVITHYVGKGGGGWVPVTIDIGEDPTSFVALATKLDAALGAFASATPVAKDGGAALQTAFKTQWPDSSTSCASVLVRSK